MKTIRILGGKEDNQSIKIVTHHLTMRGHVVTRDMDIPFDVGVSWGCSYQGQKPWLNGGVNRFNKFNCFKEFEKAGVLCPTTFPINEGIHRLDFNGPWLARRIKHSKGKDIKICTSKEERMRVYNRGKHDFFSIFIPTKTEYRVWVFKDKAFAIQEKVYKGEGEYKGFLRNNRFGFMFEKRDNLRGLNALEVPCILAVGALGMDFGAVDILQGKDEKYYVLEVNSMPQIDSIERSSGKRLAGRISKWAEKQ